MFVLYQLLLTSSRFISDQLKINSLAVKEMQSAGAQLAGSPQHKIASHFIDLLNEQRASLAQEFRGVVFFASQTADLLKGVGPEGWYVMDMQKHIISKSRSPIRESDAFVLFDEARCR